MLSLCPSQYIGNPDNPDTCPENHSKILAFKTLHIGKQKIQCVEADHT